MVLDKQASDVVVLHTEALTSIADYFVIGSGNSERHVRAIAEAVRRETRRRFGERGTMEGEAAAKWLLLDYGDVLVHIFQEDVRAYYGLENMWRDAPHVPRSDYDSLDVGRRASRQPESINAIHQAS